MLKGKSHRGRFFYSALLFTMIVGCTQQNNESITIAVASNMQRAMGELTNSFTKNTGVPCELVIGSSGKLTAQIMANAPYDLFVSADMKYPMRIYHAGMAVSPPKIYAFGSLIIWTLIDTFEPSIDVLTSPNIKHIAIANPKTAPYGTAAIEVLKNAGIYDSIVDKLVYGESVSQVNQFVVSKSAEIGFTAQSVVYSSKLNDAQQWKKIEANFYTPISQGAVLLKSKGEENEIAGKFYDFLFSEDAVKILKSFGYQVNKEM